jgi:hypothetical protein
MDPTFQNQVRTEKLLDVDSYFYQETGQKDGQSQAPLRGNIPGQTLLPRRIDSNRHPSDEQRDDTGTSGLKGDQDQTQQKEWSGN